MTTHAPVVSVVIPCYNAGAWIAETVGSVVTQADVPLEIVLVDDGSDDDSVELARRAAGSAPMSVVAQQRMGASRARNVGTQAARGALIQYLDADDVLLPDTIRARVYALEKSGGDIAYCDWVRWERQPNGSFRAGEVFRRQLDDRPDVQILRDAWWPPGALLYRRAVVDRILPWREDLPIIQDARFLLDAALAGGRFVRVDHVGLKYRCHDDSLSRRDTKQFLQDCLRNAMDLQTRWTEDGSLDEPRRRSLVDVYAYLARSYFRVERRRFAEVVSRLKDLDPEFLPAGPPAFRAVSRVVGYPGAEYVAGAWHRLKRTAHRIGGTGSPGGA